MKLWSFFVVTCLLSLGQRLNAAELPTQYRSFNVTMPLGIIGNEAGAKIEYNLGGEASVAVDGIVAGGGEEFDEEKVKKEQTSLVTHGYEAAVTFTRFTQPTTMAGFFWALGAGYRQLEAELKQIPDQTYQVTGLEEYNEDGQLTHKLVSSGMTGRFRLGYRYSAESLPLLIGCYFGMRHFENKFKDVEDDENPKTTDEQREKFKRLVMTRVEGGLEVGVTF